MAAERPRGSVGLYALAFALVVASAVVLGVAALGLLASTGLLWASIVLSVLGGIAAAVSITVRRP